MVSGGSTRVRREYHFPTERPRLRGVSHQYAAWGFASGFTALLVIAPDWAARGWVAAHALGITGMLVASAVYHRSNVTPSTRYVLRRLDHSAILLAIAGSYTGVAGLALSGTHRTVMLAVVWGAALAGIFLRMLVFDGLHPTIFASYLLVGWAAVLDAPTLIDHLNEWQFALLLSGGVMYTLGALVLACRRPNPWPATFGYHEIFHALVVASATCHFLISAWLLVDRR